MSFIYGDDFDNKNGGRPKQQSSNSYANGDNQNCGNVITDRPSIKLHHAPGGNSQVSFGAEPSSNPAPQPQSMAHYEDLVAAPGPPATPGMKPADAIYYKNLTLPELRVLCRERGLNPGGGKEQLYERLTEAIAAGTCPPIMIGDGSDENVKVLSSNNYARADGQNTGNFLTDRNSSRVLAAPGGASSICFGDSSPVRPHSKGHSVQKEQEITGHDIFGEENEPQRAVVGGVRKDPGGGSSLVLG